jgi:hypothetical protein
VRISGHAWSTVATFWLRGERLDPDVITRVMGIEPNRADRRGEPRASNPQYKHRTGAWTLESENVLSREDDHLDDHLRWLLDRLEPRAPALAEVVADQGLDVEFWCVVWMDGPNCDFALPPETIGRVAALGAALRLDIYESDDVQPE